MISLQLQSVDWDMNLQLAQASKTQMKETNALFHLNLSNSDTGKTEKLLLEFNHEELLDFYNKVRSKYTSVHRTMSWNKAIRVH